MEMMSGGTESSHVQSELDKLGLPAKTIADVEKLNKSVLTAAGQNIFREAVSRAAGRDGSTAVKYCLAAVMSDELAMQYTFHGRFSKNENKYGKQGFKKQPIWAIMEEVLLEQTPLNKDSITKKAESWLQGRKKEIERKKEKARGSDNLNLCE